MKILITNDDGWDAPGIEALISVAQTFGDCVMVAPALPQSGISHQVTMHRPLELVELRDGCYSVDGTPADCVRIGLTQLAQSTGGNFDLVLSGINNGANMGSDVYVSGTVAAAREAALLGVKAIAISQHRLRFKDAFDWTHSHTVARKAIEHCLAKSEFSPRQYLNVNLPDVADHEQIPDFRIVDPCDLDSNPLPVLYSTSETASGKSFTYIGRYNDRVRDPNADIETCFQGDVPVTTFRV